MDVCLSCVSLSWSSMLPLENFSVAVSPSGRYALALCRGRRSPRPPPWRAPNRTLFVRSPPSPPSLPRRAAWRALTCLVTMNFSNVSTPLLRAFRLLAYACLQLHHHQPRPPVCRPRLERLVLARGSLARLAPPPPHRAPRRPRLRPRLRPRHHLRLRENLVSRRADAHPAS